MRKAVLFAGQTQSGNVNRMLGGLKRAIEGLGIATTTIDTGREGYAAELAAVAGDVDFFLAMTGIGLDLRAEDNVFNTIGKPFVSVYLDPLIPYAEQVRTPIKKRIITTTADSDVAYWAAVAPDLAITHLPHAAEPVAEPLAWEARDIDLLFPATGCGDPEEVRRDEWPRHGATVAAALNAIVEEHHARPLAPLTEAIATALKGAIDMANPFAVHPYFVTVDSYLRGAARWRALAGLAGLPVTVAGPGWEAFRRRHPDSGFCFLGPCPADAVQTMIGRSRAVVNACTGYHGSHERVLDAQAAGALAVTTPTGWFRATVPGDAVVYLNEETPLRALLDAPERMAEIAARGHAWQAAGHTWRHRAEALLARLGTKT